MKTLRTMVKDEFGKKWNAPAANICMETPRKETKYLGDDN
jgi:hypothetical protein